MAIDVRQATAGHVDRLPPERRHHGALLPLLLLAAALFLVFGSPTISAPFGDSHDGRNGGVWASGSHDLRENGPVESRLGTHSTAAGTYANHPPLLYVETAIAETVGLGSKAATRAPAWIGSLVALVLLAKLLRERGVGPGAVGVAVLFVVVTPMFLVYGTMLDTPVTSLPFGVGVLLLWERARRGNVVHPLAAAAVAGLASLAGWQGLLLAFMVGGWSVLRRLRHRGGPSELAFAGGALAGAVLLVLWLLWAFGGSLQPLLDQFLFRTGASTPDVGPATVLGVLGRDYLGMFGAIGLMGLGGFLLALRDPRTRALVVLTLAVILPYCMVFRTGTVNHSYWGYWFVLPIAVGIASGADGLLAFWRGRGRPEAIPLVAAALLGTLLVVGAKAQPPQAESLKIRGLQAAATLARTALPPDQRTAFYAGGVGTPAAWVGLATGRPSVGLARSEYATLAAERPADLVLVGEVRCQDGRSVRTYELRPAASLVDRPPVLDVCPPRAQPDGSPGR